MERGKNLPTRIHHLTNTICQTLTYWHTVVIQYTFVIGDDLNNTDPLPECVVVGCIWVSLLYISIREINPRILWRHVAVLVWILWIYRGIFGLRVIIPGWTRTMWLYNELDSVRENEEMGWRAEITEYICTVWVGKCSTNSCTSSYTWTSIACITWLMTNCITWLMTNFIFKSLPMAYLKYE